jgi:preprotein translocase subunit SecG
LTGLITIFHVLACLGLIVIVLLQRGKGASMGAAFGGASQTVFGSAGATPFLGKVTTVVAIIFMLTSLSLAFFAGERGTTASIVETKPAQEAPVQPPAPTGE